MRAGGNDNDNTTRAPCGGGHDVRSRLASKRFYRAERATRDAVPGSGLGLAITKALTEAHGGQISVASVEDEGTVFTILLRREATGWRRTTS